MEALLRHAIFRRRVLFILLNSLWSGVIGLVFFTITTPFRSSFSPLPLVIHSSWTHVFVSPVLTIMTYQSYPILGKYLNYLFSLIWISFHIIISSAILTWSLHSHHPLQVCLLSSIMTIYIGFFKGKSIYFHSNKLFIHSSDWNFKLITSRVILTAKESLFSLYPSILWLIISHAILSFHMEIHLFFICLFESISLVWCQLTLYPLTLLIHEEVLLFPLNSEKLYGSTIDALLYFLKLNIHFNIPSQLTEIAPLYGQTSLWRRLVEFFVQNVQQMQSSEGYQLTTFALYRTPTSRTLGFVLVLDDFTRMASTPARRAKFFSSGALHETLIYCCGFVISTAVQLNKFLAFANEKSCTLKQGRPTHLDAQVVDTSIHKIQNLKPTLVDKLKMYFLKMFPKTTWETMTQQLLVRLGGSLLDSSPFPPTMTQSVRNVVKGLSDCMIAALSEDSKVCVQPYIGIVLCAFLLLDHSVKEHTLAVRRYSEYVYCLIVIQIIHRYNIPHGHFLLPKNLNSGPYCPYLAELGQAADVGLDKLLRAYGDVVSTLELPREYAVALERRSKS